MTHSQDRAPTTVREFSEGVVGSPELAIKLSPPPVGLADHDPIPQALRLWPVRSRSLVIRPWVEARAPSPRGYADSSRRPGILHALANHELQAVELFAWALLAFPEAPREFRQGLLAILREEQIHCRLYIERLESLGGRFGEHPVTGHFWNQWRAMTSPARFVAVMGLTFEGANLDHAEDLAALAEDVGDIETAEIVRRVHRDEIRHVSFGWHWLGVFKDSEESMWDAWNALVRKPLGPERACGRVLHPQSRRAAGLDEAFIDALTEAVAR
ncbi:MAG: DUF455 family protein [Planctomycetota bacterium]|nr:DUF455 family protein [Planctomycetota bacterium]